MLGRAITLLESQHPAHRRVAVEVLEGCLPFTGKSMRIGITGAPGAGKSTFIEALGKHLLSQDHRIAVLAIDPSSSRSKGSILGDKTRMPTLATHQRAFVRPSPAGDTLGGVASRTREIMMLCEAADFDVIIVETVGVGQSETAVRGMVDMLVLVLQPGAGDELQGMKRGIVELADLLLVNKADGDTAALAQRTRQAYSQAIRLLAPAMPGWTTPVLTCSALEGKGIDEVWATCLNFFQQTKASGALSHRRSEQLLQWLEEEIQMALEARFYADERNRLHFEKLKQAVAAQRTSVPAAVMALFEEGSN